MLHFSVSTAMGKKGDKKEKIMSKYKLIIEYYQKGNNTNLYFTVRLCDRKKKHPVL